MRKRVLSLVLAMVMLMSMGTGMTLREEAEPETTPLAETTQQPDAVQADGTAGETEDTVLPEDGEDADTDVVDADVSESEDAPTPEESETPTVTEEPSESEAPSETEEPVGTEEPAEATEEPAADGALMTLGLDNEIMPIATLPQAANMNVAYQEKNAAFVPSGEKNTVTLRISSLSSTQVKALFEDPNVSFKLKGPGESNPVDLKIASASRGTVTGFSVMWWSLQNKINQAGTYTLTVEQGGQSVSKTFEVVKVDFKAAPGHFPSAGDTYTGYCSSSAFLSGFDFPTPVNDNGGEFLGWSNQSGKTSYADTVTSLNALDSPYTAYAVYGEVRRYDFDIQDGAGKSLLESGLDLGTMAYSSEGYTGTNVTLKNTGNQPLKGLMLWGTPTHFTVTIHSTEAALDGTTTVTIAPKKGLGFGTYEETVRLWFRNQIWKDLKVKVVIGAPTATVTMRQDVEKEYGKVLTSEDLYSSLTVSGGFTAQQLGLTFNCMGFAATAGVGGYPVTLASGASGYDVQFTGANVKVTAATPKEVLVNPGGAFVGQTLRDISLNGTFTNPNQPGWSVSGKLEWVKPDQKLDTVSEEGVECAWKFTPEGNDASNYTTVSGTVKVIVSDLTPTNIYPSSGSTFTYDGREKSMSFKADREGAITVQYSTSADPENWSDKAPIDAGTYIVKATMEATATHARGEVKEEMVIEPRVANVHFAVKDKVYDGTADVSRDQIQCVLSYLATGDDGKVELGDVTAVYDNPNVGRRTVTITVNSLGGEKGHNYVLHGTKHNAIGMITAAEVSFRVKDGETITKEYGEDFYPLESDLFEAVGLAGADTIGDLHPEFTSAGAERDAMPGDYDVTVSLPAGGNYTLTSRNAGTVTVTKAVPKQESVSAGSGMEDSQLDSVSLTGEFITPHTREVVPGVFTWKDGSQLLPMELNTIEPTWRFTIDEDARDKYAFADGGYTAEGTVTVQVTDKEPIGVTVSPKTVEYDGEPQSIDEPILEDGITTEDVEVRIEYRKHLDVAAAALELLESSHDDYVLEEPTEAGKYDVHVHVYVAGKLSETRADNLVETVLTITPTTPAVTEQTLKVPQGTILSEVTDKIEPPIGKKGEELTGELVWDDPNAPVEADGGTYLWTFYPDSENYGPVHGQTRIDLADDSRTLDVKVFNLPDSDGGYYDYAVVKLPGTEDNTLKAGEQITFYNSNGEPACDPAEITQADLDAGHLEVRLNVDALSDGPSTLTARITSSVKHAGVKVNCPAELGFTAPETLSVYKNEAKKLGIVVADGYDDYTISVTANTGDGVSVKEGGSLDAAVVGERVGSTAVQVTVTFPHPDQENHKGQSIAVTRTVFVTVGVHPGEVKVEVPPQQGAPEVSVHADGQKTLQDEVLTDEDKEQIEQGVNVTIKLVVTDGATVTAADKAAIESFLEKTDPDLVVGQYLDISLLKTVGEKAPEQIHSTDSKINLTLTVPADLLKAGRTFRIIRLHDGFVETLAEGKGPTITFQTDRFSTYAIVYRDKPEEMAPPVHTDAPASARPTATPKPTDNAPATGDENAPGLWLGMLALCAAGLTVVLTGARRGKKRTR